MPPERSSLVSSRRRRLRHVLRRWRYAFAGSDREPPTYSIIGAKRAGTSSLNEYIVRHPQAMHGFVEKGCRYYDVNYHRGRRWFERHLPPRGLVDALERTSGARPIFGESSPYYSFHGLAPARMARDLPDLRLIFLLRDPVQRAWSHHHYEVARGFESLSFEDALRSEKDRLSDSDPGRRAFAHQHYSYASRGLYGHALTRLLAYFPPESILVMDSEQLFERPRASMHVVFRHLGLAPVGLDRYPVLKSSGAGEVPLAAVELLSGFFDEDAEVLRSNRLRVQVG